MPIAAVNGTTLSYERTGEGPALVLLHPIAADGRIWSKLVPVIAGHFDVINIDLRGHGGSGTEGIRITTELLADDIRALLLELGVGEFQVIGASLGGTIACHLACDEPERVKRMVLISTWYQPNPFLDEYFARMAEAVTSQEAFADFYVEAFRITEPPPSEAVLKLIRRAAPAPGPALPRLVTACAAHDAAEKLPRIEAPVLTIVGQKDPLSGWQGPLLTAVPQTQLIEITGGGHNMMFDKPQAIIEAVKEFLSRAA